ncbi:hypothetical protein [Planococcus sp. 107-1]|uniref:hypothetical protein n=1 Tax=Planococcus sp. 107-1 TaxID=2908840 RepID=UPI001F34B5E8|nr:hypothetical protein [Planococcus sp. 107-1]UJF25499.1 hypothetical protein L0M13_09455 [Planococcus sp. 107-1]
MFRKFIILLLVIFFMLLIIFTAVMFLKNEVEVYSNKEVTLAIEKPMFINLSEPAATEKGSDRTAVYDMSLLGLNVGTYTLVERTLENGASLIFEEIKNTGWIPYALSLNVKNLAEADFKSWNPETAASLDEEIYGPDPTTNPYGVFTRGNTEILQGNVFVSRNLQLETGDWVQELRHEIPEFTLEEGVLAKNYWLPPKHQSQTWMMATQEPLFETEKAEDEWITFSLENPQAQLNWLTPQGPFVKLPLTDDPRTQLSYGFITVRTADLNSIEWNETSPSLFFESMILNSENYLQP